MEPHIPVEVAVEPKYLIDGHVFQATEDTAEFWGVYTYDAEGFALWDSDHETRDAADRRAGEIAQTLPSADG